MSDAVQVFKARKSMGGLFLLALAVVMGAFGGFTLSVSGGKGSGLIVGLPLILLGVLPLLAAAWLPGMRYILTSDSLTCRVGPFSHRVELSSIRQVERRDMTLAAASYALTLPGVVIGKVSYADLGMVTMFSTAMVKGVLLITTDKGKLGITPERDEELAGIISQRVSG